ncbi:hypothetical protein KCG48_06255 [Proteiniclasticum sp. BAD-10]|uniref:DUF2802 domain-containing protein n=1 Tax=Proteiniclasticum sediminis TaxID=2804028 RepID=A0A941CNP4_9CLOT|nr:hypothetical protein [Proteiniclasticum sediminis]MBR0575940.1 hypothetical protein [Proteiniclasticum sediminis]
MFIFLMILGSGVLFLGLSAKRQEAQEIPEREMAFVPPPRSLREEELTELKELNHRVKALEKLVFESLLTRETEKAAEETIAPEVKLPEKKPMPESMRTVVELEKAGHGVQEMVAATGMKKGEILLLLSLSKHYAE